MKTVWNDTDYRDLRGRLERLTPETPARWGKMDAPQMVCHLTDALRMVSGQLRVAPKNLPIRFTPLKQLIIYCMPFPRSAPTAPELRARQPTEWQGEIAMLRIELEALITRGAAGPFVPHPAFGALTPRTMGVLVYRHMDHHLTQFGV
ncbi:MAG TPA: DUF1569 domain-containing protein [Vicinamibacterales bacterium]|nr:DUF1569 domain-containing protein [Vicinamibacterales bacterium]